MGHRQEVENAALRNAVDASMDGIAVLDSDGDYRYVNEAHAAAYGVDDPEEMIGWNWRHLYDDEEAERLQSVAFETLAAEGRWRGETVGRRMDGELFQQELSLTTLDGGGLVCVVRDVSDRHERTVVREERRDRLATILDHVPVVLFAIDADGTFTLSKGTALTSLGMEPDEAVGENVATLYGDYPEVLDDCERALDGERVSATRQIGDRAFETAYEPVRENGEVTQVIGISLDVTERERFREGLSKLHEATRELAYANSEAEVVARVVDTVEEVIDRPLVAYWQADDEPATDRLEPVAFSDTAREFVGDEFVTITGDTVEMEAFESGETRVVENYAAREGPKSADASLGTVLLLPVGEHGLLSVATSEVREVPSNERRLLEVLTGNAAAALDSAARERQIAEQSDRTDFLNSLLRHDLINGLQITEARLDAAVDHVAAPHDEEVLFARDWCGEAMEFIEKTRAVLNAIANHDHALEPVDVGSVAREAADSLVGRYPSATVDLDTPEDPAVVAGDEMVSEVVWNVVSNAVAHHDGDDPWVGITVERGDARVAVCVEDDGPGISTDTVGQIFDRGATTDPDGGSGFGLYFVDVMMDKYGGSVEAWNRDGHGAAFEMTFERL